LSSSAYDINHWIVQAFILDIVELYETWNKPEKVSQYRVLVNDNPNKKFPKP
jgi:hypothetical protein